MHIGSGSPAGHCQWISFTGSDVLVEMGTWLFESSVSFWVVAELGLGVGGAGDGSSVRGLEVACEMCCKCNPACPVCWVHGEAGRDPASRSLPPLDSSRAAISLHYVAPLQGHNLGSPQPRESSSFGATPPSSCLFLNLLNMKPSPLTPLAASVIFLPLTGTPSSTSYQPKGYYAGATSPDWRWGGGLGGGG